MKSSIALLIRSIVLVFFLFPVVQAASGNTFVYVSLDTRQCIAVYAVDPGTGGLGFIKEVAVSGQPGSLAVDPTRRFLYAAIRSTNSVSSFRIDPATGNLTLLGTMNVNWNPVYIRMDRTGAFLFTVHFGDNKAAVYSVGNNGAVQSGALQVVTTAANPHSIQTDPSNRYLFVPCRTGETILEYRLNDLTGAVTANSPDRVQTPDSTGPRHMAFHPFLNMAYSANEFGRSVTAYSIDTSKGCLTPVQTLSMQSGNTRGLAIAANTGGADVHATPDGRFIYATNRGPDSIAAYRLDPVTGMMTFVAHYPTEKMPRSFAIDPSGTFLFAAGQASGNIAAYRIDSADGRLSLLKTYAVGPNPVWVLVVHPAVQGTQSVGDHGGTGAAFFSLSQNFPNPFNPETTIQFTVPTTGHARLRIWDTLGHAAATLFDAEAEGGKNHHVQFNAAALASGLYISRLEFNGNVLSRKIVLLK